MHKVETAGGIIVNPEGKIILVEQGGNSWSFPKGHVEEGEELLAAARREIFEETGLRDVEYVSELGSYKRYSLDKTGTQEDISRPPRLRTIFLFRTSASELQGDGKEITDARFVSVDEALTLLTHPRDREFLEEVRSQITG